MLRAQSFVGQTLQGPLTVSGSIVVTQGGTSSAELSLTQTGTSGRQYNIASTNSGYGLVGGLIIYDVTGAQERMRLTSAGAFTFTGTVGATDTISTTKVGQAFAATAATTNPKYLELSNSGAAFFCGMESSGGGNLATGAAGYTASVCTNATTLNLGAGTGSTVRMKLSGTAITNELRMDMKSYTVATLPSAATAGGTIYVSDASGTPCLAFTNGTNWKRCDNAATTIS